jgi:thiosulfate/3-mercaptopyruvate sulfurtransferase
MTALFIAGSSCTNYQIPGRNSGEITANSCEGCHTDYDRLIEEHTPDDAPPLSGYGTTAPHIEPYDRVYLDGEGFEAFKASPHYPAGCTGCHNGVGNTGNKEEAHSGEFIKHPSLFYEDKCGSCHEDITQNFTTSLHQGTGLKRKVTIRSGLSGPQDFDQLPAHQIEGYNNNCAHCHGSCGNCHVVRPAMGGGGLSAGHNFNGTPDNENVCEACHEPLSNPDLHQEMGFDCLSCHDGMELHGNGEPVDQRYAYTELPTCEKCHPPSDLSSSNSWHRLHFDDFSCNVCHSQTYENCGSCHINGEGARIPSYMDYKIAKNPLPDVKEGFELALVRRTTAAPDNWKEYGVEAYENFAAFPTYNYTTPHNLQRWTERTNGTSCNSNCHIRMEGTDTINKELYLFTSDLLEWELQATGNITVDDVLPASWMK